MEPPSPVPLTDSCVAVLLELSADGLAVTDDVGRLVRANDSFMRLFGYERDQLLGRPVEMLLPESDRLRHREHRRRLDEVPTSRPMGSGLELRARHADGTTFRVEVGLSPIATADGLFTVMAVRPLGEDPAGAGWPTEDQAVIHERDRLAAALNDVVIQKIFSAGLQLHGLLEEANVRQLAVLNSAIDELDDAIRQLRIAVFDPHRHDPDIREGS